MENGHNAYKRNNTMGMSQIDLILMVYRGAINFLEQAKLDFAVQKFTTGRTACDRARKCMVHLYTTLDMEKGAEIAEHLGQLYAFVIEQIDLTVADKSMSRLDELIQIITTLKEGWDGIKQSQEATEASGTQGESFTGVPVANQTSQPSGKARITISA